MMCRHRHQQLGDFHILPPFEGLRLPLKACLENRSDVIQVLDVDARAEGPNGQGPSQDETLPV